MKKLDREEYERMIAGARAISRDTYGNKVLRLQDGLIVKLFRLKRIFSSAVIWPYAKRFERGAKRLRELHIPSVEVVASFRVRSIGRDIVVYRPLDGEPLRDALRDPGNQKTLLTRFSAFFARLHDQGIYFRGIHFGNVIVIPNGMFGLIDLSEIHFSRSPLSISKRIRNFKPIFRYKEDRAAILSIGFELFLDSYMQNSNLSLNSRQSFFRWFRQNSDFCNTLDL